MWIVDPLDGTREFSELDRDDWAVHVALWQDGELVAGAVALPAQGITLATPDVAAPPPAPATPRIVVSRTRPPAVALAGARRAERRRWSRWARRAPRSPSVVQGRADVYVHAGGQYEWDSAAPVAVARAAGLHTSRIDGSPLQYNRPDPLLPDLVVCRPELRRGGAVRHSVRIGLGPSLENAAWSLRVALEHNGIACGQQPHSEF